MYYYALRLGPMMVDWKVAQSWDVSSVLQDTKLWHPRYFRMGHKQHAFFSPLDESDFNILQSFGVDEMHIDVIHKRFSKDSDRLRLVNATITVDDLRCAYGLKRT